MNIAYSYIRFSSERQKHGDSYRRQLEKTKKYCSDNNLILNESTYNDLGVSGYKQKNNLTSGALSLFLHAIETGKIKSGSTLVIESLDRLTRQAPTRAFNLLTSIVDAGITVVTLVDDMKYTPDNINDPSQLFISIGSMLRSYDESKHKSVRSTDNWDRKEYLAREHRIAKTSMCPFWLKKVENHYELITDHASIVKEIFELYAAGNGYLKIANILNTKYATIEPHRKGRAKLWYEGTITKIIKNPATIGIYHEIEDYFPPAISIDLWQRVHNIRKNKLTTKSGGRQTFKNVLAHLVYCINCMGTSIRITRNAPNNSKKYVFVCNTGRLDKSKCNAIGWDYDAIEGAVLRIVRELNINSIITTDNEKIISIEKTMLEIEHKLTENNKRKERLLTAIESSDEEFTELLERLKTIKEEESAYEKRLGELAEHLKTEKTLANKIETSKDRIQQIYKELENDETKRLINIELKNIIKRIYIDTKTKQLAIVYKNNTIKHYRASDNYFTSYQENDEDRLNDVHISILHK